MENNTILISNDYGNITEYKLIEDGKWTRRIDFGDWYDLKGDPPKKVLEKFNKKKQNTITSNGCSVLSGTDWKIYLIENKFNFVYRVVFS